MKGTYRGSVGGGEKEEGCEEGEDVCGHSEWPGQETGVLWGQEDKFPSCIVIRPLQDNEFPYPPEPGRPSSGMQWGRWFGCRAGIWGYPGFFYLWVPVKL